MQSYLRAFAAWHGLSPHIHTNTRVVRAVPVFLEQQQQPVNSASDPAKAQYHSEELTPTTGVRWLVEVESVKQLSPQVQQTEGSANNDSSPTQNGSHQQHQHSQQQQQQQPETETRTHEFDALVVCNGHYSEPNLPSIPGMESCQAFQMHSHNYRTPDRFEGQVRMLAFSFVHLCADSSAAFCRFFSVRFFFCDGLIVLQVA